VKVKEEPEFLYTENIFVIIKKTKFPFKYIRRGLSARFSFVREMERVSIFEDKRIIGPKG